MEKNRFLKWLLIAALAVALIVGIALLAKRAPAPDVPEERQDTPEEQPDAPEEQPDTPEEESVALEFASLGVEFVIGERDSGALLELKKTFPALLKAALEAQGCTVSDVNLTFGTSAAATVQALRSGEVQLAWLPSEVYAAEGGALHALAEEIRPAEAEETLGVYLTCTQAARKLAEQSGTAEELLQLSWAIPAGDETALRFLDSFLTARCGKDADALTNVTLYRTRDDLNPGGVDAVVLYADETDGLALSGVLDTLPLCGECVAAGDGEVLRSAAFRRAFQAALAALTQPDTDGAAALARYGSGEYRAVSDADFARLRFVLGEAEP